MIRLLLCFVSVSPLLWMMLEIPEFEIDIWWWNPCWKRIEIDRFELWSLFRASCVLGWMNLFSRLHYYFRTNTSLLFFSFENKDSICRNRKPKFPFQKRSTKCIITMQWIFLLLLLLFLCLEIHSRRPISNQIKSNELECTTARRWICSTEFDAIDAFWLAERMPYKCEPFWQCGNKTNTLHTRRKRSFDAQSVCAITCNRSESESGWSRVQSVSLKSKAVRLITFFFFFWLHHKGILHQITNAATAQLPPSASAIISMFFSLCFCVRIFRCERKHTTQLVKYHRNMSIVHCERWMHSSNIDISTLERVCPKWMMMMMATVDIITRIFA